MNIYSHSKLKNLKFSTHQNIIVTGDIEGNTQRIKDSISYDKESGVDLSVFPETAISGYMCGSLWDREDFVKEQARKIYEIKSFIETIRYKGAVIVGFVDFLGLKTNGYPHLKNAVALIKADMAPQIYHKQLLASADHHEDKKYFDRGDETKVFTLDLPNTGPIKIGVPICEDAWYTDHSRNIAEEMVAEGAELIVHINQSYFYYGKQEKRKKLLAYLSNKIKTPIISVNALGIGDIVKNIIIFDGGSMVFDHKGRLVSVGERFKEYKKIETLSKLDTVQTSFYGKYTEIIEAIVFEQKQFFSLMGLEKAQVHVSGGLDSAIVAALAVMAMGKENVVLISNPTDLNSDSIKYVHYLEKKLGVKVYWDRLQMVFDVFMSENHISFPDKELSLTGQASVQATLRTVQGLAASHRFGTGIIATGNHTEIVLGWASFHDIGSIGVHAIIGDLTKTELYQLAQNLNAVFFEDEVIPEDLYNGVFKPAAELPDAKEDPIDYALQSGICALLIRNRMSKTDLVEGFAEKNEEIFTYDLFPEQDYLWSKSVNDIKEQVEWASDRMKKSVYKAAQSAPIVIISPRSRGFSNREVLINKYKEK